MEYFQIITAHLVGVNLESEKLKDGKGIIKVSNRYFADWEMQDITSSSYRYID